MRSSCEASERKRRRRSSLAWRSPNACSIWPSIALSARPRRPTSVRGVGRADAAREVAGGDRAGGRADAVERPQAEADQEPGERGERERATRGDHDQLDVAQAGQGLRDVAERHGDDRACPMPVSLRLREHAVLERRAGSTESTVMSLRCAQAASVSGIWRRRASGCEAPLTAELDVALGVPFARDVDAVGAERQVASASPPGRALRPRPRRRGSCVAAGAAGRALVQMPSCAST